MPARRRDLSLHYAYNTEWRDYPSVFVLSTGRCGTETLTALAGLSPQLMSAHEPRPRLIKTSFDAYLAGASVSIDPHWRDVVLASRDDFVRDAASRGRTYVETNNRLTYLAPALASAFPASRFIHLYREPYAFVRSAMRRNYYAGHPWDFSRIRPKPHEPLAESWNSMPRMDRCAWLWSQTNQDALTWLATLPTERRLSLSAEDLFAGRDAVVEELFAFCGVAVPPGHQVKTVLGAKMNAQSRGDFPEASAWPEDDRALVWSYVGDVAGALGYAKTS